jgi:hypothetical protein
MGGERTISFRSAWVGSPAYFISSLGGFNLLPSNCFFNAQIMPIRNWDLLIRRGLFSIRSATDSRLTFRCHGKFE